MVLVSVCLGQTIVSLTANVVKVNSAAVKDVEKSVKRLFFIVGDWIKLVL